MAPKAKENQFQSSLGINHIPHREKVFKNADLWLEDKKKFDGAEGLWRVHDGLYDVSDFIKNHPGGRFWLDTTKGMDITEAFECHHISTKPENVLKKYFVRKAKTPRNSPFTFEDDGFYRTLKRNVRETLKTIPKSDVNTTKIIIDVLLAGSFVFATLATTYWSYFLGIVSGIFLASTAILAHNYYHQKDNFRIYYSDMVMLQSRQWRIVHILSHHLYTNSVVDLQACLAEPMLQYFPQNKSILTKYASWFYAPAIFWPVLLHFLFFVRMYQWLVLGHSKQVSKVDLFPFILPLTMYAFSGQTLLSAILMWSFVTAVNSFWVVFAGITTTHYHPEIFIDGDKPRSKEEFDWGISQLDTVSDRYEVMDNQFLSMVTFGDHALHHLFPTLDHGILHHLYPVVRKTMKQFNLDIRMTTHADMVFGYFRQLAKDKPNPNPPCLIRNK